MVSFNFFFFIFINEVSRVFQYYQANQVDNIIFVTNNTEYFADL